MVLAFEIQIALYILIIFPMKRATNKQTNFLEAIALEVRRINVEKALHKIDLVEREKNFFAIGENLRLLNDIQYILFLN